MWLLLLLLISMPTVGHSQPEPTVLDQTRCCFDPNHQKRMEKKYTEVSKELCQSWLTLDLLPTGDEQERETYQKAKDGIKSALLYIYRNRLTKPAQAEFIETATPSEFADAVLEIYMERAKDFPSKE